MDGTIWKSEIDWLAVRREIGLPYDGRPIYAQIMELPAQERSRGLGILQRYEALGAENGELIPGTQELLQYLRDVHVKCALVTNNSRKSLDHVLKQHPLSFDTVLTRDDGALKPDPQAFLTALERMAVPPDEAIGIGDAHLDLIASDRAGVAEFVLVGNRPWVSELLPAGIPHYKAANLVEAREIITRLLRQS